MRNVQAQSSLLLVFAHKAEAEAFLLGSSKVASNLFHTGQYDVVLTGEGRQNVTEVLSSVLAQRRYERMVNLGCVASLLGSDGRFAIGNTVTIAAVYQHILDKTFEYRSFSFEDIHTECFPAICVSMQQRLHNNEDLREYLSYFGDVVDRELWAVASVGRRFQVQVRALKIISDCAEESCQDVRKRASDLSLRLFEGFKIQGFLSQQEKADVSIELLKNYPFYATTSQRQRLVRLLPLVKSDKYHEYVDSLRHLNLSPKKKTSLLIQKMESMFHV